MLDKNHHQEPVLRITDSLSFKSKCQAWHLDFRVCVRYSSARLGSATLDGWLWALCAPDRYVPEP